MVAQLATFNSQLATFGKVYKMSTKRDELVQRVERAGRIAKIRARLGLTGDEFAAEMTKVARQMGLQSKFDKSKVSRLESGDKKTLTAEELTILTALDPDQRGPVWLLSGRSLSEPRMTKTG